MAINKVEYGSDVLIDLTADTVDETSLLKGATAHDMKGEPITGTLDIDDVVRFKNTETDACYIPDLPLVPFANDMLRGMLVGESTNVKYETGKFVHDSASIMCSQRAIYHNLQEVPNFVYVCGMKTLADYNAEANAKNANALLLMFQINLNDKHRIGCYDSVHSGGTGHSGITYQMDDIDGYKNTIYRDDTKIKMEVSNEPKFIEGDEYFYIIAKVDFFDNINK